MKKILLVLAAVTVAAAASAEGYQVNNLSSKQNGMGHVGTAMKLNSESLWFNPAAAVFQDTKFDISVGVTGIASKATYTSLPDYTGATKPVHYTSDNKLSTPMFAYVNYKPLDWMSVGVAFNTPFGSSMNWGDDWAGSQLIQSINLAAYNFQPTVSFRIGKHFSIGGGLMLTWGNFDLSRSLLPIGADNAQNQALMGALQMLVPSMPDIFTLAGNRSLMSLGIEGSAKMAVGVNLGVMWDINEQWSLGMNFRSKQLMKVDSGSIDLRMIDDPTISQLIGQLLPQLGLDPTKLTSAVVRTELPLPASMTWGVSFRPVPKWEFAIDLQYVLWARRADPQPRDRCPRPGASGQREKLLEHAGLPLRRPVPRLRLVHGPHGYVCRREPRQQRLPQPRDAVDDQTGLHGRCDVPPREVDGHRHCLRLRQLGRPRAHGLLSLRQFGAGHRQREASGRRGSRLAAHQCRHGLLGQLHGPGAHLLDRTEFPFLTTPISDNGFFHYLCGAFLRGCTALIAGPHSSRDRTRVS